MARVARVTNHLRAAKREIPGGYYLTPMGVPPQSIGGAYYRTGLTILLMIVTIGIWGIFWTYRTNEDLKRYNGDGLGGVLGIVIYLLLSIVLMFTIPNEIEKMYHATAVGAQSPRCGACGSSCRSSATSSGT